MTIIDHKSGPGCLGKPEEVGTNGFLDHVAEGLARGLVGVSKMVGTGKYRKLTGKVPKFFKCYL